MSSQMNICFRKRCMNWIETDQSQLKVNKPLQWCWCFSLYKLIMPCKLVLNLKYFSFIRYTHSNITLCQSRLLFYEKGSCCTKTIWKSLALFLLFSPRIGPATGRLSCIPQPAQTCTRTPAHVHMDQHAPSSVFAILFFFHPWTNYHSGKIPSEKNKTNRKHPNITALWASTETQESLLRVPIDLMGDLLEAILRTVTLICSCISNEVMIFFLKLHGRYIMASFLLVLCQSHWL